MTDTPAAKDDALFAPLKAFGGERPPAPDWFTRALSQEPERGFVESDGARIETLAWGTRGKPGLMFFHGYGANADWWDFIAPSFAQDYRVAAISWSGMGRSDWREAYTTDGFLREALAAMEALGLNDGPVKPIVVGHSFGSRLAAFLGERHGERLKGVVIVDPPIFPPDKPAGRSGPPGARDGQQHKVYPDFVSALSRFRFEPPQTCAYPCIVDHIARHALKEVEGGYTWRFDPNLWHKYQREDAAQAVRASAVRQALIYGSRSALYRPEDIAFIRGLMRVGEPIHAVDAAHHLMVDLPQEFCQTLRDVFSSFE